MLISTGMQIDRFEVQRLLGEGGLARVYLVRHRKLDSLHAMKLLAVDSERAARRFIQEGQVQARIRHPNVVAVTDVVELGDEVGLVMEYVEGTTLADVLGDGRPLPRNEIGPLFAEMCAGVDAAHREGVLHRDLKPGNVLLSLVGGRVQAKIADFGIAKVLRENHQRGTALTEANTMMGTPGYMAPEQLRDAATVDARADVFSLGCILYEMCCGRPPYLRTDRAATFSATLSGEHRPLLDRDPTLPPALCEAVERAIAADPNRRFETVRQFAQIVAREIPSLEQSPTTVSPFSAALVEPTLESSPRTLVPAPDPDAPSTFWNTDEPYNPRPFREMRVEPPKRLRGDPRPRKRASGDIVDFRRNRRWRLIDLVAPVFGVLGVAAIGALLADGAAGRALDAAEEVRTEGAELERPWADASADLAGLMVGAENPRMLVDKAEAARSAPSPERRIELGRDLVRTLRGEVSRQMKEGAAAQQSAWLATLHQLDIIDAAYVDYGETLALAAGTRGGWAFGVAERIGWVGPDSDPTKIQLPPMPALLAMPPPPEPVAVRKRR